MSEAPNADQLAACWDFAARFADRLAHDLSNIFTGVTGFSDLALLQLSADHSASRYLRDGIRSSQRGIELTHRLHRLRSGGSTGPASSSLATVFELARNRLNPFVPADVKLDLQIEAALPNVAVPSELVLNFMLELLQNAVEACGASGSVTLNASVVELSAERALGLIGRASSGRCVEMQIGDSGSGISAALRDEVIKTPMLTNKPGHWGLGLAIVFRGLYACGAGMALESKAGRGTLARVFLPIA